MKNIFIAVIIFVNLTLYSESFDSVMSKFDDISKRYGIEIRTGDDIEPSVYISSWCEWDNVDRYDVLYLSNFADVFIEEFAKYPVSLVSKVKLSSISLVKNIKVGEDTAQSLPDPFGRTIYFDVQYGMLAKDDLRIAIHHNFFRMIEAVAYSGKGCDAVWDKINNTKYKTKPTKGANGNEYNYTEHPKQGFVNSMAMYSSQFDRAETFAFMMISDKRQAIQRWSDSDNVLSNKVNFIIGMLDSFDKGCTDMFTGNESEAQEESGIDDNYDDSINEEYTSTTKTTKTKMPKQSNFLTLYNKVNDNTAIRLKQLYAKGIEQHIDTGNITQAQVVSMAKMYLGVPYVSGGSSSSGVDCSGLSMRVYNRLGINLSHNAEDQARCGIVYVDKNDLRPGDLVFFTDTYVTTKLITHVGIYIGNKKFINANSYYGKVMIDIIDDNYWKKYYIFGTRIIE